MASVSPNLLPIPPTVVKILSSQHKARLSLSAQAQLILVRKKTRKWHAALAGAIAGGLAIMFEKKSRRSVVGQQMFVRYVITSWSFIHKTDGAGSRGLQGSWNSYTKKRNIRIPYGDVLVFSLAYVFVRFFSTQLIDRQTRCGQIMYAFILRQDTLPRSYSTW
jgi:hypothetical protein